MRTKSSGRFRPGRSALAAGLLAVSLTGCTIATPAASTATSVAVSALPVAAPAAGASIVVTVPDLGSAALSAVSSGPGPVRASDPVGTSDPAMSRPVSSGNSSGAKPTTSGPVLPATPAPPTKPPGTTASTSAAATTSSAMPTETMNVRLANCPGCTVLATHAAVTSTLGAALVATAQGRAALLAIRGDGSVAGAANVAYGTSFPTPPGGQLGCDTSGRCIVIAKQTDGTAIAAAYQVSAGGTWADVTGQPGITSVTAQAVTLTVAGGIGLAVQDQADGSTVWIVYAWDGDGYSVKGCTAAATPDPNALSMTSCLS